MSRDCSVAITKAFLPEFNIFVNQLADIVKEDLLCLGEVYNLSLDKFRYEKFITVFTTTKEESNDLIYIQCELIDFITNILADSYYNKISKNYMEKICQKLKKFYTNTDPNVIVDMDTTELSILSHTKFYFCIYADFDYFECIDELKNSSNAASRKIYKLLEDGKIHSSVCNVNTQLFSLLE